MLGVSDYVLSSNLTIFNRQLPITTITIPFSGLRSKITKDRTLFSYQNLLLIRQEVPSSHPMLSTLQQRGQQGSSVHAARVCTLHHDV